MDINTIARNCKSAAVSMAALPGRIKDKALLAIADALENSAGSVFAANEKDVQKAHEDNLPSALVKRLRFDAPGLAQVCEGLKNLAGMDDPVGKTLGTTQLDSDLTLFRVARPMGVVGVIFESRPDALVQIASLCLKSGNAVLLKGGKEAFATNQALANIMQKAGADAGLPGGWLNLLETRSDVNEMLKLDRYVDLIIPRGSNEFVRYIMDNTLIPVLGHADGICHLYIDRCAEPEMAVALTLDSKCQYVAVCNALDTLLVLEKMARQVLPVLKNRLEASGVKIYGCEKTCRIIKADSATEDDWKTEYLDLKLSIRVVACLDEAVNHINTYGSGHTDAIVTMDHERALYFMDHVDTADVFVNCSTRFSDGFRFGLGAEVGISTHKIHARGPVGLDGLMTYQWRLIGKGHVVADYTGENARAFKHTALRNQSLRDVLCRNTD